MNKKRINVLRVRDVKAWMVDGNKNRWRILSTVLREVGQSATLAEVIDGLNEGSVERRHGESPAGRAELWGIVLKEGGVTLRIPNKK